MYIQEQIKPWVIHRRWLRVPESTFWLSSLSQRLLWEQPLVMIFGKQFLVPRKTIFLGENGIKYKYSGIYNFGSGWPEWFIPLLDKVNIFSGIRFTGCLLNLYRDGKDCMGWHSDDEIEIDQTKPIVSLSLGASRHFIFSNKQNKLKVKILLNDGDMLIMNYPCQNEWKHSIPKRKNVNEIRINLTFRCYK